MVAVLGAGPLLAALGFDRNWTRLFLELNLFVAVFGFPATRRSAALRIVLALAAAARVLAFAVEGHTIAVATRPDRDRRRVHRRARLAPLRASLPARRRAEHVYAALDAYVLIGIFAGLLHHLIEETWPGSYVSGGAAIRRLLVHDRDLLQLRHPRDPRLRRHRAAERRRARRHRGRGDRRTAVPGGADRALGQQRRPAGRERRDDVVKIAINTGGGDAPA